MVSAWKEGQRPQRYGWAPGSYLNHCHGSGCKDREDKTFIGDKRAIICADCAYAMPDPVPKPAVEPWTEEAFRQKVTELFRRVRVLELEIEKRREGK
jgi:hypothetical protein